MMKKFIYLFFVLALFNMVFAEDLWHEDDNGAAPRDNFSGTLGVDFIPDNDVTVDALGYFDLDGDGLYREHRIAIWDIDDFGAKIAEVTVKSGTQSMLSEGSRYEPIPGGPITLTAGTKYMLGAECFKETDPFLNAAAVPLNPYYVGDNDYQLYWAGNVWDVPTGTGTWAVGFIYGVYNMASFTMAHNPVPQNPYGGSPTEAVGEGDGAGTVQVELQWNAALEPDLSGVEADITMHKLYIAPNTVDLSTVTPIDVAVGAPDATVSYLATGLGPNDIYHWRVDEEIDGGTSTVTGAVWEFLTLDDEPIINAGPNSLAVDEGDTAVFDLDVTTITTASYQWRYSTDTLVGGDSIVGTDPTLTITDVNMNDDEGYYYCAVTNSADTTVSPMALLWFKRGEMARLRMNDDLTDSIDSWDGVWTPNAVGDVNPGSFTTDAIEGSHSVDYLGDPSGYISIPGSNDLFNNYMAAMTTSFWVKTPAVTGWMGLAGKQDRSVNEALGLDWEGCTFDMNGGRPYFYIRNVAGLTTSADVDDNQWHMITGTYDVQAGEMCIYQDGVLQEKAEDLTAAARVANSRVYLGVSDPNSGLYPYDGLMDDVRIFGEALTPAEVAAVYVEHVTDAVICTDDSIVSDYNDDCKTDLVDFAELAKQWLLCNLYPSTECE